MFFLREAAEAPGDCFRIVVTEGVTREYGPAILLGEGTEIAVIDVDPSQPSYALIWANYASYAVQPEHLVIVDEEGEPTSMMVEHDASPFLAYVRSTTFAEDIAGRLRHWELSCMNHVIHVVSAQPPTIVALPAGGSFPLP
jgi:hypothetical protein